MPDMLQAQKAVCRATKTDTLPRVPMAGVATDLFKWKTTFWWLTIIHVVTIYSHIYFIILSISARYVFVCMCVD